MLTLLQRKTNHQQQEQMVIGCTAVGNRTSFASDLKLQSSHIKLDLFQIDTREGHFYR